MANLIDRLFGCPHRKTTFPMTIARNSANAQHSQTTYIVCLDCGEEFSYDWNQMKLRPRSAREMGTSASSTKAA